MSCFLEYNFLSCSCSKKKARTKKFKTRTRNWGNTSWDREEWFCFGWGAAIIILVITVAVWVHKFWIVKWWVYCVGVPYLFIEDITCCRGQYRRFLFNTINYFSFWVKSDQYQHFCIDCIDYWMIISYLLVSNNFFCVSSTMRYHLFWRISV